MDKEFIIRAATKDDIPFIVESIIEAEKSGSEILSYSKLFDIDQTQVEKLLRQCLLLETDGCELSLASYIIAEKENKVIAAVGAWIEEGNGISSSSIKASLIAYVLPKEIFKRLNERSKIISDLYIKNLPGTLQIGVVYVDRSFRGLGLTGRLIKKQIELSLIKNPLLDSVYVQVFSNNISALKTYRKFKFKISQIKATKNPDILNFLPSTKKYSMKLSLKNL